MGKQTHKTADPARRQFSKKKTPKQGRWRRISVEVVGSVDARRTCTMWRIVCTIYLMPCRLLAASTFLSRWPNVRCFRFCFGILNAGRPMAQHLAYGIPLSYAYPCIIFPRQFLACIPRCFLMRPVSLLPASSSTHCTYSYMAVPFAHCAAAVPFVVVVAGDIVRRRCCCF